MSLRIYFGSLVTLVSSVGFAGAWLSETALGMVGFGILGCTALSYGLPLIVKGIRASWDS